MATVLRWAPGDTGCLPIEFVTHSLIERTCGNGSEEKKPRCSSRKPWERNVRSGLKKLRIVVSASATDIISDQPKSKSPSGEK